MARTLHMQAAIPWMRSMIEADQADGIEQRWLIAANGDNATYEQALAQLAEWEAAGFDRVPCCDNIDERGHCRGAEAESSNAPTTEEQCIYRHDSGDRCVLADGHEGVHDLGYGEAVR